LRPAGSLFESSTLLALAVLKGALRRALSILSILKLRSTSADVTHHTLVATLVLAMGALVLIVAHTIGATMTGLATVAAPPAVLHVGFQVLAPVIAHGFIGRAHALAVVAVLAGLVAALTTLAAMVLGKEWVLHGKGAVTSKCKLSRANRPACVTSQGSQSGIVDSMDSIESR
jgi:hypothetical protein